MKFFVGILISFAVGVGCRYFDLPVGSPAVLPGAVIVFAMTAGYAWTNQMLQARGRIGTTMHLCGGPTGAPSATKARVSDANPPVERDHEDH